MFVNTSFPLLLSMTPNRSTTLGIATLPGYFDPADPAIVRLRAAALGDAIAAARIAPERLRPSVVRNFTLKSDAKADAARPGANPRGSRGANHRR